MVVGHDQIFQYNGLWRLHDARAMAYSMRSSCRSEDANVSGQTVASVLADTVVVEDSTVLYELTHPGMWEAKRANDGAEQKEHCLKVELLRK